MKWTVYDYIIAATLGILFMLGIYALAELFL
jgi:hypothetical protein